ncbi:MAG: PAS domain S-box protein [Deltaproteobacteria bacterium]|nr:PAS domain S-box protein [Deltaproteobacteria bacterium]
MTDQRLTKFLSDTRNLIRILDSLKEGVIAHDLDRNIFFFNREAERITGYSRDEVLSKDCHMAFGHPFCGERCLFKSEPDGDPFLPETSEYPVKVIRKDGNARNVKMSVSTILDEKGGVVGVLAFIKDVTDIVKFKIRSGDLKGFGDIVGRDPRMLQIYQQIQDLAAYDYPVHVFGETGTGKELVAEAIHNESQRAGAPFVPINCGALPEGLIESELFGHVRGAFSGAVRDKKGRFELADAGTIFLDEVAELPFDLQVKLLRFLQSGTFEKVGGEKTVSVSVRIISATNKDLRQEVRRNRFREDLYYRLNVIPILLPPLREKKSDIPLLVEYFLDVYGRGRDSSPTAVSAEAMTNMMGYEWPGNVRQLQNALQFAIVKCRGELITPNDLPMELNESRGMSDGRGRRGPARKLDSDAVRLALEKTGGNKVKAAKRLGVGRATLYRFLKDHPEALPEDV